MLRKSSKKWDHFAKKVSGLLSHYPNPKLFDSMEQENKKFFIVLVFLLFAFFPELFFATSASLTGDHIEQHFPWAYFLGSSLKSFQFPFWTNYIHCGFPIAAEGQIGAFYPPNLILFFLLPIKVAYAYLNVFHFVVAGFGSFLYAKSMKLSGNAAFTSAL